MIRAASKPKAGDALARRHIAQWRRVTARLVVLMNTGNGVDALASEAHALRRQCERLAGDLACVADHARQSARATGRPNPSGDETCP